MSHTSAPWHTRDEQGWRMAGGGNLVIFGPNYDKVVAYVPIKGAHSTPEEEANADLIGTAPEMLEVLDLLHQYLVSLLDYDTVIPKWRITEIVEESRVPAVIARARGEG